MKRKLGRSTEHAGAATMGRPRRGGVDVVGSVQDQFGPSAHAYATFSYHASGPDLPVIVEAAGLTGMELVLDLATGAGHTALACAPRAARVAAIDLTPAMLETAAGLAASRRVENIAFCEAEAAQLPFDDGCFDAVTCRVAAHHFADVRRVVDEVRRVLRPGGRFVVADTVAPEDAAADTFLNAIELLRDPSHVRDYRGSEWLRMLRGAGFEAEMVYRMVLALDGADWVARQRTPPEKVALIRRLLAEAAAAIRAAFEIRDEPWGFSQPIAVFRAVRLA